MSPQAEGELRVALDARNPGQFFACCGLLELADRLWGGAEARFADDSQSFVLRPLSAAPALPSLLETLASCRVDNTMTSAQRARHEELSALSRKQREADSALEEEKKALDALRRTAPVELTLPGERLRIDWFTDAYAGGDTFKTWAGQQSVVDIAAGLKELIVWERWRQIPVSGWLSPTSTSAAMPFNFDSDLGGSGSNRDIGFSFDALHIRVQVRPLIELLAFLGLQRFRPRRIQGENRFHYALWREPLRPEVAMVAACGLLPAARASVFEFRLLYRTKYLKSFLPANPTRGDL